MNRDYMYFLIVAGLVFALNRAEHRAAYLEGQQAVFTANLEAESHVCGPYEQPTTAEKRQTKVRGVNG